MSWTAPIPLLYPVPCRHAFSSASTRNNLLSLSPDGAVISGDFLWGSSYKAKGALCTWRFSRFAVLLHLPGLFNPQIHQTVSLTSSLQSSLNASFSPLGLHHREPLLRPVTVLRSLCIQIFVQPWSSGEVAFFF